jgi:2-methylaconitate cis-trans-isomerase PrpF
MKLAEYIQHLQRLQSEYPNLDIQVVRTHTSKSINVGRYVENAVVPSVWQVEIDGANPLVARTDLKPLDPAAKKKDRGPDGVILA